MGEPERIAAAREIFAYLSMRSGDVPPCDVAIGFGHFDLRIARRCGGLHEAGLARQVIFTGGIGAGTADLGQPEALAFRGELRRTHPEIPEDAVVVESESTNTSENIVFTARKLAAECPDSCFDRGIRSAILVANPYRQRRVWRTCLKQLPGIKTFNAPPESSFEEEMRLFAAKGQDFIGLLGGEIDRLLDYGERGYIERQAVPEAILAARRALPEARGEKTGLNTA